ncbi:MAG: hypothetical protein ABFC38_10530 [Methanospirillum sp.]
MTAIVGILCQDGIVIGTDSSATFSCTPTIRTIEQKTKKIEIIDKKIIVAGTGEVGLGQRFCNIVEDEYKNHLFKKHHILVGKTLSKKGIEDFASTHLGVGGYGAIVAYHEGNNFHLCELSPINFQPEFKKPDNDLWFVSIGGGQPITDPFLGFMRRVFWDDGLPSVVDAVFISAWTLNHAIELNTGGINGPLQIATIKKNTRTGPFSATLLTEDELREHMNSVDAAEKYLRQYKEILKGETPTEEIPDLL